MSCISEKLSNPILSFSGELGTVFENIENRRNAVNNPYVYGYSKKDVNRTIILSHGYSGKDCYSYCDFVFCSKVFHLRTLTLNENTPEPQIYTRVLRDNFLPSRCITALKMFFFDQIALVVLTYVRIRMVKQFTRWRKAIVLQN